MGGKTAIIGLAAGVAAVVGAGVWFVLQDASPAAPGTSGGEDAVAEKRTDQGGKDDPSRTKRKGGPRVGDSAIVGRVLHRKDQTPAGGQKVVLAAQDAEPVETVTSADGTFRIAELSAGGPYEVSVTAEGFATVRLPGLALERREEFDVGTLWLDKSVRIAVSVRTLADEPIAGAEVRAFAVAEVRWDADWLARMTQVGVEPVPVATATTNAEGEVVFPELATGRWSITAEKAGYARRGNVDTFRAPREGEEERKHVVLYLDRGFPLTGRVLDHGDTPLEGALVMVVDESGGWDFGSRPQHVRAVTDETGTYRFPSLPAGERALWAARPGGVPAQVASVVLPNVAQFDIYLKLGGVLTGRVTQKEGGEPVEGATVRAQGWAMSGVRVAEATTDAEGRYRIDTLLEGIVNGITVVKPGLVQWQDTQRPWQQIPVNRGDTVVRDLVMMPAGALGGTVTGPGGPLAGARVTCYSATNWNGARSTTTDAEGHYRIEDLPEGKVLLQVASEGHYQPGFPLQWWMALNQGVPPERWSTSIAGGEEMQKDLELDSGFPVEGRVDDRLGRPVAGATVTGAAGMEVVTGDDGSFRLEGFAPGQATVSASRPGARLVPASKQVTVDPQTPLRDLVLVLHPVAVVRGTVASEQVGGLDDASVTVQFVQAKSQDDGTGGMTEEMEAVSHQGSGARAPVRADGSFEVDMPFVTGRFVVVARALDHAEGRSATVDIVPGQAEYQADVTLHRGNVITGRVFEKGGATGIPGARVTVAPAHDGPDFGGGSMWFPGQESATVHAVAGSDGSFRVPAVTDGSWSVAAVAEGYVRGDAKVTFPGTNQVDVSLEKELSITGFVLMPDGTPVEGASIQAQAVQPANDGATTEYFFYPGQGVVTGSDGGFRVGRLKAGDYTITVAPGWLGDVNIRNKQSDPVAAGTEGFKITVEAGLTLAGRVAGPDGKGLRGVWVGAQPQPQQEGMEWRNAMTGDDGVFELTGLLEGTYDLTAQGSWGSGDANALQPAQKKGVSAGERGVLLEMKSGLSIEGVLVDLAGKPAANVMLTVQRIMEGESDEDQGVWKQATTDEKGAFAFVGLSPGAYVVGAQNMQVLNGGRSVVTWGGSNDQETVLAGGGRVVAGSKGVRLSMVVGAKILGKVTDPQGNPMKDVWVNVTAVGGAGQQGAMTDAGGRFTVSSLAPDATFTLQAMLGDVQSTPVENVSPGASDVHLVIDLGLTIRGRVLTASGAPATGISLTLAHTTQDHRTWCQTDEEGRFRAVGLREGAYAFESVEGIATEDGGFEERKHALGEHPTGSQDVELRLSPR